MVIHLNAVLLKHNQGNFCQKIIQIGTRQEKYKQ